MFDCTCAGISQTNIQIVFEWHATGITFAIYRSIAFNIVGTPVIKCGVVLKQNVLYVASSSMYIVMCIWWTEKYWKKQQCDAVMQLHGKRRYCSLPRTSHNSVYSNTTANIYLKVCLLHYPSIRPSVWDSHKCDILRTRGWMFVGFVWRYHCSQEIKTRFLELFQTGSGSQVLKCLK